MNKSKINPIDADEDKEDIESQRIADKVSSANNSIAICCVITSFIILCIVVVFATLSI